MLRQHMKEIANFSPRCMETANSQVVARSTVGRAERALDSDTSIGHVSSLEVAASTAKVATPRWSGHVTQLNL